MSHRETAPILIKRSSVPGKTPVSGDLQYGELALNYADGVLRFKTADNEIAAFPQAKKTLSPTWASTLTIDLLAGRVDVIRVVLDGATTFTFTNAIDGQKFVLEVTQGSGGNKTYTWTNDVDISLALERSFAPSTIEGQMDRLGFIYRIDKFDLVATAFGYTT